MRSHGFLLHYPVSVSNLGDVPLFSSVVEPQPLDASSHKSSLEGNIQPRFVMLDSMLQFANELWSVLVTQVSSSSALGPTRSEGKWTTFYSSHHAVCTSRRAQESICSVLAARLSSCLALSRVYFQYCCLSSYCPFSRASALWNSMRCPMSLQTESTLRLAGHKLFMMNHGNLALILCSDSE